MSRSEAWSGLAVLMISSILVGACAPTEPVPWSSIAWVDSYAGSGEVRLYWYSATERECLDFPCPPPGPEIAHVLLQQSTSGPSSGYRTLLSRGAGGADSATIGGLQDGRFHWFRILALDVSGRQLIQSNPIVTAPGPPSVPAASIPVETIGRFTWSVSGDSIVYVDASRQGERSLAVLDLRSQLVSPWLTRVGDEWIIDAIVAGDGATVAFTHSPTLSAGAVDYQICTAPLGQPIQSVQTSGPVDFDPAWGGSGWIYFCRGTRGPPNIPEIWRVRPGDPTTQHAITSDPTVYKYRSSVRPEDDLIVFEGHPGGAPYDVAGLYFVDPISGSLGSLTPARWYRDACPFWSPDGRSIVFVSTRSGHSEVWSLEYATGVLRQLTRGPRGANRICAAWSRDGTRLAVLDGIRGGWTDRGRIEIHDAVLIRP
jgi:hypothetical protein